MRRYLVKLDDGVNLHFEFDEHERMGPSLVAGLFIDEDHRQEVWLPGDLVAVEFDRTGLVGSDWHTIADILQVPLTIPDLPPKAKRKKSDRNAGLIQTELPT